MKEQTRNAMSKPTRREKGRYIEYSNEFACTRFETNHEADVNWRAHSRKPTKQSASLSMVCRRGKYGGDFDRVFNEADLQRSALHLAQSLFKVLIPEESPSADLSLALQQSGTVPIGEVSSAELKDIATQQHFVLLRYTAEPSGLRRSRPLR
ncbi:hypothetical protein R1flu_009242 [Riccia fluitans]|uniref:Uncharacterized protein n=1 Tax=Riccia fluitans TaxID=41844 RepID=A0ABD1Z1I2_9MARC